MPITYFHLGPALFVGLILFSMLDLPTFLLANVIVDIEPFIVLALGLHYPIHGFFHSFIGGTIAALVFTVIMSRLSEIAHRIMKILGLEQKSSLKGIMLSSFLGIYLHIAFDSLMHADMKPFFPIDKNPFLIDNPSIIEFIQAFCILFFMLGVVIYVIRLILLYKKGKISQFMYQ